MSMVTRNETNQMISKYGAGICNGIAAISHINQSIDIDTYICNIEF